MLNNIVHDNFNLKWAQIFFQKCLTIKKGLARKLEIVNTYFLLCPIFFFLQSKILFWNKIKNHIRKKLFNNFYFLSITFKPFSLGQKKIPTKGTYILCYYKSKVKKRKSYCNLCCTIPFSYSTRAPGIWSRGI